MRSFSFNSCCWQSIRPQDLRLFYKVICRRVLRLEFRFGSLWGTFFASKQWGDFIVTGQRKNQKLFSVTGTDACLLRNFRQTFFRGVIFIFRKVIIKVHYMIFWRRFRMIISVGKQKMNTTRAAMWRTMNCRMTLAIRIVCEAGHYASQRLRWVPCLAVFLLKDLSEIRNYDLCCRAITKSKPGTSSCFGNGNRLSMSKQNVVYTLTAASSGSRRFRFIRQSLGIVNFLQLEQWIIGRIY